MAEVRKYLRGEKVLSFESLTPDTDTVYFLLEKLKPTDPGTLKLAIRNASNTQWHFLEAEATGGGGGDGIGGIVNIVNGFEQENVVLDLSIDSNNILTISGRPQDGIDLSRFALDANVVHKTGDETVNDIKTFTSSPKVPTGQVGQDAVNYDQLQTALADIQQEIVSGTTGMGIYNAGDPYPEATDAFQYWIVKGEGPVGGDGENVNEGDWIISLAANAGGTDLDVGQNWEVIKRTTGVATTASFGIVKLSTQEEYDQGDSNSVVTPNLIQATLSDLINNYLPNNFMKVDMSNLSDNLTLTEQLAIQDKLGINEGFATEQW